MTLRPIRVMYIIDDLGLGGAQRQLIELVKALPRDRYQLTVVSLSTTKTECVQALRDTGVSLTLISQSGRWSWTAFISLARLLWHVRPAIVHTWLFTADLYGRVTARLLRVPVVISTVHSVDLDKPRHYVAADWCLKPFTDYYIATAEAVRAVLREREGVLEGRIRVVYNGVNLEEFSPASANGHLRVSAQLPAHAPLIGIVGRLAPVKDHATFLRAAALVVRRVPQAQFLVIGDGPLAQELHRLAEALALQQHVRFVESRARVSEVFSALDAVVVSSRYEGCCNVILEAMAMGKPVVATAVGGNPELVRHNVTGWLVPPQDPQRLAEALIRLLQDPAKAQAMGRASRRRVEEQFQSSRMVGAVDRVYRDLLGPEVSDS